MPVQNSKNDRNIHFRVDAKQLLLVVIIVLVLYVIIPQISTFRSSLAALEHVGPKWVILAAFCYLMTAPASALLYKCLALGNLPYLRTVAVQYGSSFANRLLPGGLGALGVGYFYLRKQGFNDVSAAAVVALNNILGMVGHFALIVLLIVLVPARIDNGLTRLRLDSGALVAAVASVVALIVLYLLIFRRQRKLAEVISGTVRKLAGYRHHRGRVVAALVISIGLTLLYSSALWASGQALNAHFDLAQAVLILAVGVGIGAAVPLPGGLGGAEAGLVAGLLAFGQSTNLAIAVAILYRLVTYWLGFLVGAVAFSLCRRRGYF